MTAILTTSRVTASPESGRRVRGYFSRVLSAIVTSRQRRAEQEIAEILARRGGVMAHHLPTGAPLRSSKLPAMSRR